MASTDFITKWKTDNTGNVITNSNQICFPGMDGYSNYDFTIDWGDNSSDTITSPIQAELTHTYATAGTYIVTVSGTIENFVF